MKKLIATLQLLVVASAIAQDRSDIARKIIEKLSSPEMHGRGYVQQGDALAADYIANWMREEGVEPELQSFQHDVNTFPDSVRITVNGHTLRTGVDYIVDPASGGAFGAYSTVLVNKDNFTNINLMKMLYSAANASGKLVVIDPSGIRSRDSIMEFRGLVYAFADHVPVILLTDDKLTWGVRNKAFKHAIVELKRESYPGDDAEWDLNIRNELKRGYTSMNVIATIPGTHRKRKKEYIFVTAHYDHLGRMGAHTYIPGANDNASGVSMLLQLLRHFKANPLKYTMVFIAFAGEEAGLVGSKFYTEHPTVSLNRIEFLLNLDLLGTGDDGITVVNGTLYPKQLRQLTSVNDRKELVLKVKIRGEAANSDHYWFTKANVPAFFVYTLGGTKAYHDVNDRADQLPLTEFDDLYILFREFLQSF